MTKVRYMPAQNLATGTEWIIRVDEGQDPVAAFLRLVPLLDRLDNKDLKR